MKLKGTVELYQIDRKTGQIYNRNVGPNMIVETGKEFMLDEALDNDKWNSGSGVSAIALGISTDTNDGVLGPNVGREVDVSGPWQGVSEDDWRLTSEIARSSIIKNATSSIDQRIDIFAQFVDAQFSGYESGSFAPIREVGLFLHPTTPPAQNPQDYPANKPYAMVGRRLYYGKNVVTGKFVDAPYWKPIDGNPLMMKYTLEML